jgi:type VI protein secretion system component Hcp
MLIDGISGTSKIAGYEKWLELRDFDWGGTRGSIQPANSSDRGRLGIGTAPQLRAVKVVRGSNHQTPELWNLMLGLTKKAVEFVWLRTNPDGTVPFMKLKLDNALITSMAEVSDSSEPEETISLTYEKITLTVVNVGNELSGPQDIVTYDLPNAMRG